MLHLVSKVIQIFVLVKKKTALSQNNFISVGINSICNVENINVKQLSIAIKYPYKTVLNYSKSVGDPKASFFTAMHNYGIDIVWMLTGIGQMYQSDQSTINEAPAIYRSDIIDNRNQAQITTFIENWYKTSSDEEKVWMNIQMQRCFPEYKEFIADSKADSSSQKKQAGE